MKKIIFGSSMFIAGLISSAILFGCAMMQDWMIDDYFSVFFNLDQYGLMPVLAIFLVIACAGFVIACRGLNEDGGKNGAAQAADVKAEEQEKEEEKEEEKAEEKEEEKEEGNVS